MSGLPKEARCLHVPRHRADDKGDAAHGGCLRTSRKQSEMDCVMTAAKPF